ncbi:hypothetical protein BESB_037770 [Besnoitia besnoiti]|uniref:Calponin-homology (CH) domain-containing protein n=1 Tax=Besnoitia besnoiti TaxID=94643 RepID=A0A2A9MHE0_BESBE|nr:hypothetical protein BESB_037770 [Besnoitia besnoiti]PFH37319.1 hypothetical protein BESB_037770 [Besnoitia besnoiti]
MQTPEDEKLISWVNETLGEAYTDSRQLHDGVAYALLVDGLLPGAFPLHRLRLNCASAAGKRENFSLLLEVLAEKLSLRVDVDVASLVADNGAHAAADALALRERRAAHRLLLQALYDEARRRGASDAGRLEGGSSRTRARGGTASRERQDSRATDAERATSERWGRPPRDTDCDRNDERTPKCRGDQRLFEEEKQRTGGVACGERGDGKPEPRRGEGDACTRGDDGGRLPVRAKQESDAPEETVRARCAEDERATGAPPLAFAREQTYQAVRVPRGDQAERRGASSWQTGERRNVLQRATFFEEPDDGSDWQHGATPYFPGASEEGRGFSTLSLAADTPHFPLQPPLCDHAGDGRMFPRRSGSPSFPHSSRTPTSVAPLEIDGVGNDGEGVDCGGNKPEGGSCGESALDPRAQRTQASRAVASRLKRADDEPWAATELAAEAPSEAYGERDWRAERAGFPRSAERGFRARREAEEGGRGGESSGEQTEAVESGGLWLPSAEAAREMLLREVEAQQAVHAAERRESKKRVALSECQDAIQDLREQIVQKLDRHRAFLADGEHLLGERNFYFEKLCCIQRKIEEGYADSEVGRRVLEIINARPTDF